MTRKKVKLEYIVNDTSRKASFRKRKLGLLKKMKELTTLCGIQAMAIIYGPDDIEPATYPSDSGVVHKILDRFMNIPEIERSKKMLTQETFLKERAHKTRDLIKKQIRKNQELEMDNTMYQLHHGKQISEIETYELLNLFFMVKDKMDETHRRIEYHQNFPEPAHDLLQQDPTRVDNGNGDDNGNRMDVSDGGNDADRNSGGLDEWFIDMLMNNKDHENGEGSSNSSVMGELGFGTSRFGFDGFSERNGGERKGVENINNIEGNDEMGFCENGNFRSGNKARSINGGNDKDLESNINGGNDDKVEGKK